MFFSLFNPADDDAALQTMREKLIIRTFAQPQRAIETEILIILARSDICN